MRRLDPALAVLAIAGLAAFVRLYESAFPQAAIDLELSRGAIRARADEYVRGRGIDPDTFLSALTFRASGDAAVFLQRTRGLDETVRFAREVLPLWRWRSRWFRSGEKEEFSLSLGPDGEPIGFEHAIPEAAPGDSLTQDSARARAAAFVTAELAIDLSEWRLADQATKARDHRIDHTFTWEKIGSEIEWRPEDPEAGTASLRLSVDVLGSEIAGFGRFLKVPEKFLREQDKVESSGTLLAVVSIALMFLLVIAALVVGIVRHKNDLVGWRWALVAGGVVMLAVLTSGVLSFPLLKANYQTNAAFPTFLAIAGVAVLVASILYGLIVWVTGAAGESLTREAFPDALRALRDWIAGRWLTPAASTEVLRGYAVGLAFIGYITVFYVLGRRHLGVWLPADSPHSEILAMYLPWLVPALVAIQASVSEEFTLRLFAIPLLKRYLKITFVALLIPAMIWAFGHSNYPVYPVYVRGIELTIAGLLFGWVFIRYGIVTMLVAHYAIDAILIAMPFLRARGGSYVGYGVAALVCAALPLVIPALARLWGQRGATPAQGSGDGGP
jgi:hypothetical protein